MARMRRNREEGRSSISRGRKLHDLQDSESEEELRRFLQNGADGDSIDEEEKETPEAGTRHRPYRIEREESFGSLGQFWMTDS